MKKLSALLMVLSLCPFILGCPGEPEVVDTPDTAPAEQDPDYGFPGDSD